MPTFQELLQQANREGYRDGLKAGQARGEAVGILEGIKAGQSNAVALLPAVKAVLMKGIITSEPQVSETVSKSTIIQPPDVSTQPAKSGSDKQHNDVYYHGTDEEFPSFQDTKGVGISFTPNKTHAHEFGSNVHTANLAVQNPIDIEHLGSGSDEGDDSVSTDQIQQALADHDIHINFGKTRKGFTSALIRRHMPEIIRQAKQKGYDGMKLVDFKEFEAPELVVFDPSLIHPITDEQEHKSISRFTKSHELLGMGTDIDTTSSPELRNRAITRLMLTHVMRGGNFLDLLHSDLSSEREDAETQIEEAIAQLDTESPHVEPDGDEYEDGEGFVGEQDDHDETTEELDREQDMLHAAYDEDLDTDEEDSDLEDFDDEDDTDDELFDDDDDMDDDDSDLFDDEDDDDDYYETEDDDDTYTDEDDQ